MVEQPAQIQEVAIETVDSWDFVNRECDNVSRECCNVNRVAEKNRYEINRVSTHNGFEPLKITLSPNRTCTTEVDTDYPKFRNKPVNNKSGPKRVELGGPKKKRVYRTMVDIPEEEEDPQTIIIAPVMKTMTHHQRMSAMTAAAEKMHLEREQSKQPKLKQIAPVSKRAGICTMRYHVTDATKYLASVKKMTQNGNRVVFDEERSFIQNKRTGQEMDLISEKGVYKLDVVFMNGEKAERGKIVIDSGAADNVMPAHGLPEVPMQEKEKGVNFSSANGKAMANHGRKEVEFVPLEFWEAEYGYPFQGQAE